MTENEIFAAIDARADACCSAVVELFYRQTADEQAIEGTKERNGMGYNATDAGIMCSFAKQILETRAKRAAGQPVYPNDLSPRQLSMARAKLRKYGRQLLEIAAEKAAARAAKTAMTGQPAAEELRAEEPKVAPLADRLAAILSKLTPEENGTLAEWVSAAVSAAMAGQPEEDRQPSPAIVRQIQEPTRRPAAEEPTEAFLGSPSALVEEPDGWRWKTAKEHARDTGTRHGIALPAVTKEELMVRAKADREDPFGTLAKEPANA